MALASRRLRLTLARAGLVAFAGCGVACGGVDRGRPDEAPAAASAHDPGSGPFSCEPVPRTGFGPWSSTPTAGEDSPFELELWVLDDFETGAAQGGWYANSDVCEDCQKLMDARDAVAKLAASLAGLAPLFSRIEDGTRPPTVLREVLNEGLKSKLEWITTRPWNGAGGYPWGNGIEGMIGYVRRSDPAGLELLAYLEEVDAGLRKTVADVSQLPDIDSATGELTKEMDLRNPEHAELVAALREDSASVQSYLRAFGWGLSESDEPGHLQKLTDRIIACAPRCDASETPNLFQKPLPAAEIPGGRCGSRHALHLRLSSAGYPALLPEREKDWGGQLSMQLSPPADASEWEGIAFWARVAPESRRTFRMEVADVHTSDQYRDPDTGRSICNPEAGDVHDNAEEGCDKFGTFAVSTSDWQFFAFPFDELRQKGWGLRAPYLDVWGIWSVGFMFDPGEWDVWIDDVAFYRRKQ